MGNIQEYKTNRDNKVNTHKRLTLKKRGVTESGFGPTCNRTQPPRGPDNGAHSQSHASARGRVLYSMYRVYLGRIAYLVALRAAAAAAGLQQTGGAVCRVGGTGHRRRRARPLGLTVIRNF